MGLQCIEGDEECLLGGAYEYWNNQKVVFELLKI